MELHWVTPVVAVASRPRGDDWLRDEIAALRHQGLEVLVSCLTGSEERELGLVEERSAAVAGGLDFVSLPIPDRGVPESRAAFERAISDLVRAERAGRKIAVHCRQGLGRSPLVAAALLVSDGMTPAAAWALVSDRRGVSVPETEDQRDWLTRLATPVQLS